MIKKNILGKTGIEVSVIGFGGAPLGDLFENLDDQVCYDTLKNSHKNGINFFDTSPYYGYGDLVCMIIGPQDISSDLSTIIYSIFWGFIIPKCIITSPC